MKTSNKNIDPDDFRLQPGPAFFLQPNGTWNVEDVPALVAEKARFSGFLAISGYWCMVFELDGDQWAQKAKGNVPEAVQKLSSIAKRVYKKSRDF